MDDFWQWWQHIPERIDPVVFQIGSFRLQYYGLMYIAVFAVCYALIRYRWARESRFSNVTAAQVTDLVTAGILGVIIGGRLGYVLFYNLGYYLRHPLEIVLPFSFSGGFHFTGISGMSFHGGLIAIILFSWLYIRSAGLSFRQMADLFIPAIPLGYTFGRLGNFINGELYGRDTDVPWGMYFPLSPQRVLRHPSQLYEAFFEGIVLFIVLWSLRKVRLPEGAMLALFLIGYGTVRFFIEFVREPDAHLGPVLLSLSMGQLLCAAMIVAGIVLFFWLKRKQ
ncbi:Prolipoprotein diacylglyceryl transferase [Olavius algarvensis associated proteobacterium Delta 3]|nr:Prolipoprotein diacylglyceryl transferase [Olavius algarvensis associated proteobacterium Delta 3]CAB5158446.1 Prolipoprotein diacylglyceryl transferase [Olavius algarvensis associated proteobacterium Delta 3]